MNRFLSLLYLLPLILIALICFAQSAMKVELRDDYTFSNTIRPATAIIGATCTIPGGAMLRYTTASGLIEYSTNDGMSWSGLEGGAGSTFNPGDHSITEFIDVSDAGSGMIIQVTERTNILTALAHISQTTNPHQVSMDQILNVSETLAGKADLVHSHATAAYENHLIDTGNPHLVRMDQVLNASETLAGKADLLHSHATAAYENHLVDTGNPHLVRMDQVLNASETLEHLTPSTITAATIQVATHTMNTAGFSAVIDHGTAETAFTTINLSQGNVHYLMLGANTILSLASPEFGTSIYQIIVEQNHVGNYELWDVQSAEGYDVAWLTPNGVTESIQDVSGRISVLCLRWLETREKYLLGVIGQ